MVKVAVIITVFNRREITLQGLHSLYKAIAYIGNGYLFDIYLTDDGCTDGTSEAVSLIYPEINIIKGDGSLFWAGGMNRAWQAAIDSPTNFDFYLWYNDDTILYEMALRMLFNDYEKLEKTALITGACCDSQDNTLTTYGGRNENELINPSGISQRIKLMNGNVVLIHNSIVNKLGILNSYFKHSLGDFDYGLRAQRAGIDVMLSSNYVGICDRHDNDLKYCNPRLGVRERLMWLYSPRYDVIRQFRFNLRYRSLITAIGAFFKQNIRAIFAINM